MGSRTARILWIILALLPVNPLWAQTDFSDWYADYFRRLGNPEVANTGLTTFPLLGIPIGGEYEAMATAYTAAARDVTYLEANPAASSDLRNTELAIFHNNLIADANLEGMGYTTRIRNFGVGVGGKFVHVPFTEYNDFGVQQGSIRFVETVVTANASYNFLNSFYFNGVAAGANVKAAYRRNDIRPDQSFAGIMTDLGLLTRFNFLKFYPSLDRNFAVGTVIRNLGPNVGGEPLPTDWTTGISYSPLRPLLIGLDLSLPFTPFSPLPAEPPAVASGVAVTVTDFFIMRGGFRLRGGNPRISMGGSVTLEDITLSINYTLDMTTQLTAFDRFSVQASFALGDRGRGVRQEQVRTLYLDALQAFAAGDLEETIELTQSVVNLDPTFQPAAETLEMARQMLALQEQMDAIRSGPGLNEDPAPANGAGEEN